MIRGGGYLLLSRPENQGPPLIMTPPGSKHERKKAHAQVRTKQTDLGNQSTKTKIQKAGRKITVLFYINICSVRDAFQFNFSALNVF